MKPILQKIPVPLDCSFAVRRVKAPHFNIQFHFHPEYELVLILKSEGKRFVGDSIANFYPGDLVLVGSNVPHWYRNDAVYYEGRDEIKAESIVIQFSKDFLGDAFLNKPETIKIREILNKSAFGLVINGTTKYKLTKMIVEMLEMSSMEKIIHLLSILNILSNSTDTATLTNDVSKNIDSKNSVRLNKIYEYVLSNYTGQITVNEVAQIINMSTAAFSRYFKKRTGKTFSFFLNEVRISHACKLLLEDELTVTQICFTSGYNNVSYFNRQFKSIKNQTPQEFRNAFKIKRQYYKNRLA